MVQQLLRYNALKSEHTLINEFCYSQISIIKGTVAELCRLREHILRFLRDDSFANFFALKAVNSATSDFIFWWNSEPAAFAFRSDATRPLTITGRAVPAEFVSSIASFLVAELYSGISSVIRADVVVFDEVQKECAELCPGCSFDISRRLQLMVYEIPVLHATPLGLSIRSATLNDLQDYLRLYQQFLEDTDLVNADHKETLKQAERNISDHNTFLLVHNECIIGSTTAMTGEEGVAKISAVCVSPEFRGRGFAKYLISAATDDVVTKGFKCMLYANSENAVAIKLYERCGYVNKEDSVQGKLKWLPGQWRLKIDEDYFFSEINEDDKHAFVAQLNDIEVTRNMFVVPCPYTETDALSFVAFVNDDTATKGRPWIWAIRNKHGYLIGSVALKVDARGSHKASIGYWLAKPYWGRGLMTKAVAVAVDYAFKQIAGLVRIEASVRDVNEGSAGVLVKNGFKEEGFAIKYVKKGDEYFDCKLFARVI